MFFKKEVAIITLFFYLFMFFSASFSEPQENSRILQPGTTTVDSNKENIPEDKNTSEADSKDKDKDRKTDLDKLSNYLYLVFLGNLEYGNNSVSKTNERLSGDENYKEGSFLDGRLVFYLKGKIKGKYLVSANVDTDKQEEFEANKIFRNLDPDKYYPIYGDSSERADEVNSQGKLYLLVEWDKSKATWGNFNTGITVTQLASHNRSLYGGKIYLESVRTNSYSDPNTKLIAYNARAQHLSAHNEFFGAGTSLYYLQRQNVVEGSEKITVEVRDKYSNLPISSVTARPGFDYEIDYDQGRIIFTHPVASVVSSEYLFNQTLLDGNKVFIVVDYEYEPQDFWDRSSYGVRVSQNITNNFNLGGTYINENKANTEYALTGIDTLMHLGGESYLALEYATSKQPDMANAVSYDGGISWMNMANNSLTDGRAGNAQLVLKPSEKIDFNGYFNQSSPGFSSTDTSSYNGAKKYGFDLKSKLSEYSNVLLRYDYQRLNQTATYITPNSLNASTIKTGAVQYQHKKGKWSEYVEYSAQSNDSIANGKVRNVAAKIEYTPHEKLNMYAQNQTTLEGEKNNQTIVGVNWKFNKKVSAGIEEIMGNKGAGTRINVNSFINNSTQINTSYTVSNEVGTGTTSSLGVTGNGKVNEKTSVYSNYLVNESIGGRKNTDINYGVVSQVSDKVKMFFENKYQYKPEENNKGIILGTHYSPDNIWDFGISYERGEFNNLTDYGTRDSGALSAEYNKNKLKGFLKGEVRKDAGIAQVLRQYLVYFKLDWNFMDSFYLAAKSDYSLSFSPPTATTIAKLNETNVGIAYRPSKPGRFNCLAKYTRFENIAPPSQVNVSNLDNTKNDIYAFEGVYKLSKKWELMEKYAYKKGQYISGIQSIISPTHLWLNRLNYHLNNKSDFSFEYRILKQKLAKDEQKGFLVEYSQRVYNNVWVGAGYNFTNFSDEFLTRNSYDAGGWFIRLIGEY